MARNLSNIAGGLVFLLLLILIIVVYIKFEHYKNGLLDNCIFVGFVIFLGGGAILGFWPDDD